MHVRALADANIVTTADVCNTLIISVLFVFIHIMQLARSCEDGDKPRPYGGCSQHVSCQCVACINIIAVIP